MKQHPRNHKHTLSGDGLDALLARCGRFLSHRMGDRKRGQDSILEAVAQQPGITQKDLANHLDIQPASVSELLMKLEHKELICREKDDQDRRSIRVDLTDAGREVLEQKKGEPADPFQSLSDGEQVQLRMLLTKLLADWEQRYPGERKHHGHKPHHHHHEEDK